MLENKNKETKVRVFSVPGIHVYAVSKKHGIIQIESKGIFSFLTSPLFRLMNKKLKHERPACIAEDKIYPSCWLPPIPGPVFTRLIRAEILTAFGHFVPETVSMEVVRENNPNCTREGPLPDKRYIKNLIDQAQDMGAVVITFTEGDPLLNDDIYEYIDHVDKTKSVVMCYTWGLNFSAEKARRLKKAGLQTLLVSLYSTDPKEHDEKRGIEGAYRKAVNAIQIALNAGLFVVVATHTNNETVDKLQELYDQSARLGAHEFSVWETVPDMDGNQQISPESRRKIRRFYKKINKRTEINEPIGTQTTLPRVFSNTVFETDMFGSLAGRRWLHIGVDGDVTPDPYIPLAYGNAHKEPLRKIWKKMRQEPLFRKKRKNHPLQDPIYRTKVNINRKTNKRNKKGTERKYNETE